MFDKSADRGNEVTVAHCVYSLSRARDLPRNFNENACQNFQYLKKNRSTTTFHGPYSYRL